MKILVSAFFPRSIEIEGIGRVVSNLAESFQAIGHEVTVVAPFDTPEKFSFNCINYQAEAGGRSVWRKYAAYRRLAQEAAAGADLIFPVEISPSFLMSSSCLLTGAENVFIVCMGVFLDLSIFFRDRFNIQNLYHYLLKNKIWSRVFDSRGARFIVATRYQLSQLRRRGVPSENIHIIPFGINPEQFKPRDKGSAKHEFGLNGELVLSYIGHFSPIKGVPGLLRAYERLHAGGSDTTLAIAWSGKGRERNTCLRLIDESKSGSGIRMYGRVDVPGFLSAVEALVLPYTNASIPHFPLLILEAFALGVPVATTDVGGLSEIIIDGETGILVPPNRPQALAAGIGRLLQDDALREKIARNARRIFEKRFNSFAVAEKYVQLAGSMPVSQDEDV